MTQKQHSRKILFSLLGSVVTVLLVGLGLLLGVRNISVLTNLLPHAAPEPAQITIDTAAVLGGYDKPWHNLAQGGEDHEWRLQPIGAQVKSLNPEYIRLDHIFDFYDIVSGTPGNVQMNFTQFDLILSDIKAVGAKPYISLSYMAPSLAQGGELTGPPVRYEDWQYMVQKTIEHVSGTRAIDDVYYEVWNEPDLFGKWKYFGDRNYLTLYTYAAQGAQAARVQRPFKLGGPATTALYKNWFDALLTHVQKNNLKFDFFSWHRYDTDINIYRKDMTQVREWMTAYPALAPTVEFHITEWGHDSNNNPGYDTSVGAAHTVAGAIEMVGIVSKAFVFEIQDGRDPAQAAHWGRWGLFTHADAGARQKPRFAALKLLERLGSERLKLMGKGSFVKALATRSDEKHWQVMLVNYDPAGKNSETVPVTLSSLSPGEYTVTFTSLTRGKRVQKITAQNSSLTFSVPLSPYEVVLAEISAP